ncbi:MAG: micrococcal nuclease [Parcubacteria group bacterium LiPW_39]|nr:MAG: micrococcal nuclease [Parcubacteria group bacterium LiPW_39]
MNFSISKQTLVVAAVILILFIGIEIGFKLNQFSSLSSVLILPSPSKISLSPSASAGPTQSITTIKSNENLFKVTRVIDGDTIEIEGGERVRYIGIDTPETVDPRQPVQCFGIEASKKNKDLVEGKMVRLEKDITDRDKYNRLLRYVWVGDLFVNLELVKQGFAYSYSYPPDIKYQDQLVKVQQEAREAKRGLWDACPDDPRVSLPSATPSQTVSPSQNSSNLCLIKGNINSLGEKIYHLPGCGSYSKTKIDESRGERWFCSEPEAQAAGWRRALNCP